MGIVWPNRQRLGLALMPNWSMTSWLGLRSGRRRGASHFPTEADRASLPLGWIFYCSTVATPDPSEVADPIVGAAGGRRTASAARLSCPVFRRCNGTLPRRAGGILVAAAGLHNDDGVASDGQVDAARCAATSSAATV
jgi:hypothetical protein